MAREGTSFEDGASARMCLSVHAWCMTCHDQVTGNVMSEEDPMRPVALPVTATAQDPSASLFASPDVSFDLVFFLFSCLDVVLDPSSCPLLFRFVRLGLFCSSGREE